MQLFTHTDTTSPFFSFLSAVRKKCFQLNIATLLWYVSCLVAFISLRCRHHSYFCWRIRRNFFSPEVYERGWKWSGRVVDFPRLHIFWTFCASLSSCYLKRNWEFQESAEKSATGSFSSWLLQQIQIHYGNNDYQSEFPFVGSRTHLLFLVNFSRNICFLRIMCCFVLRGTMWIQLVETTVVMMWWWIRKKAWRRWKLCSKSKNETYTKLVIKNIRHYTIRVFTTQMKKKQRRKKSLCVYVWMFWYFLYFLLLRYFFSVSVLKFMCPVIYRTGDELAWYVSMWGRMITCIMHNAI